MGVNINELDDVQASTGVRQTPDDGDYNLLIDAKYSTNARGGTGYKMQYTALDGPFQGHVFHDYINITNKNEVAQSIGRGQIKALMLVTGVQDSDEVDGKMVRARMVGKMEDYVSKQSGQKTKIVNLRPVLFMTTDGKDANGNDVQPFVASKPSAKEELAAWRAANLGDSSGAGGSGGAATGSGTASASQVDSGGSDDLDDEIPF